jgi:hypothetical protein
MQKSKFIRCFRLVSRLQFEQLKVMREIRESKGITIKLVARYDTLQRRKEKIEAIYKTI